MLSWAGPAWADDLAERGCDAISARLTSAPAQFLPSWDGADGLSAPAEPALNAAAFTYDNAVAAIALVACGRVEQASIIARALADAARRDRSGQMGRLRNAYRAGALDGPPLPHGWWDAGRGQWLEDSYQVGIATGNAAWAVLALANVHGKTKDPALLDAAGHILTWITNHVLDSGRNDFLGGLDGDNTLLTWKSTEHHADLAAAFTWADHAMPGQGWGGWAKRARAFLSRQWDPVQGRFAMGTGLDGVTPDFTRSGLDAQLWPLLLDHVPPDWNRAKDWVRRHHRVAGGYSFAAHPLGFWTEGTAQAALIFADDRALHQTLAKMIAPSKYLWATREARVGTGLAIGPASTEADFFYYRRPHLGATAWAVLAVRRWNPFSGKSG